MNKNYTFVIACALLFGGCSSSPSSSTSADAAPKKERWGWVPFMGKDKDTQPAAPASADEPPPVARARPATPAPQSGRLSGEVYAITETDTPPQNAGIQAKPVYPAELRRKGIAGSAVLSFVVTSDGSVRDIRLVSATQAAFADAAIDAVQKWRFKPATKGGQPVNCAMHVPVVFNL